jgi:hypothetical protein
LELDVIAGLQRLASSETLRVANGEEGVVIELSKECHGEEWELNTVCLVLRNSRYLVAAAGFLATPKGDESGFHFPSSIFHPFSI